MRAKSFLSIALLLATPALADPWQDADQNGEQARQAFLACSRFVDGWLQHADPVSGLIPRNLAKDFYWNARDAAADNYPFMVLSAFYTNRALFDGRMHDMLRAEQRLTNRVGALPDDFVFATQSFRTEEPDMAAVIFGASEYVKDGLLPLNELLGPSPWTDRMIELLDGIWEHAEIDTEVGKLPSTSHEVCGELMQGYARVYWMTGEERYRDRAFQLAAYFLDHHSPIEAEALRLDDHGCEVIGGLSEVYYIASKEDAERHARWKPEMHRILDRILEVGRDAHGLLYNRIDPRDGKILDEDRTDNWGYNYNAFLVVAQVDDAPRFEEAVRFTLQNLMANKDFPWEGDIADGIADSLEGGLNLMNRLPEPAAAEWADYMAVRLLAKQRDTGVVAGWHGDGNFARTALMWALWKTQGCYLEPWRNDLRIGAVPDENGGLYLAVSADWPWEGTIRFDIPRHSEYFEMPDDYPRLNQFPEWFTVAEDAQYTVDGAATTGAELRAGLPVTVDGQTPVHIAIARQP
ncbi:MAG: hypothetical protein KF886_15940 [Candidatus Hydrogenedentes bacterium]|nr:hypothetical protein [Candidatus Hydrogenedentota bacterium]